MAFTPSRRWLNRWPWDQSTIVRLEASLPGGKVAQQAAEAFITSLSYQSQDGVACKGGYCVKLLSEPTAETCRLEFYSSGEDGFSSLLFGVEDFEDFLAHRPGLSGLNWQELAPQKSNVK